MSNLINVAAGLLELSSSDFAHNQGTVINCGSPLYNEDDSNDSNDNNDNNKRSLFTIINEDDYKRFSSASLQMTNCSFSYQSGYSVYVDTSGSIWIDSSAFRGPRALALRFESSNKTVISNCTFNDARTSISECNDLLVVDSVFDGGDSQLQVEQSTGVRFDSCVFRNATTGNLGFSAVWIVYSNATFTNCSFTANNNNYNPLGNYKVRFSGDVDEDNVDSGGYNNNNNNNNNHFGEGDRRTNSNGYGSSGALVLSSDTEMSCYGCSFHDNVASSHSMGGGAVFVGGNSRFYCSGCQFVNNIADYSFNGGGGAVFIVGVGHFQDTLFAGNSANYSANGGGGAIFLNDYSLLLIESGCSFVGNTADYQSGGAVYQYRPASAQYAPGTVFDSNWANNGGALYIREWEPAFPVNELILNQTYFYNNTVKPIVAMCLLVLVLVLVLVPVPLVLVLLLFSVSI